MLEDHEAARERCLTDKTLTRLEARINNPGVGISAESVRARFDTKR